MGGNEGNRNSGESGKRGSGIHRDFKLYPAFRRLLLTGIIGQWQSVGKRADTLDGSKKQVNNNVDGYFAEILNKISVEHYLVFIPCNVGVLL